MGVTANAVRKPLVMVVDDDDDIRETLAGLLEDEGYQVAAFPTGQDALLALKRGLGPRVILLDLKLPKIDGLEVLRRLRADARTQYVPVVVLTTSSEQRDIVDSYDPTGPFGAKGVGEPTCVSTAAAILNAIHDAVGVRITQLPATAERVYTAIKAKRQLAITAG